MDWASLKSLEKSYSNVMVQEALQVVQPIKERLIDSESFREELFVRATREGTQLTRRKTCVNRAVTAGYKVSAWWSLTN